MTATPPGPTGLAVDLDAELVRLGEQVDAWTRATLVTHISRPGARLGAMAEYHLGWRDEALEVLSPPAPAGKKLRPALVLLVSQAVQGQLSDLARDAAVAIELVHNFSLVHDDIQDRSALRRHRPTVWHLWGTAQGINVGDTLFALAQLTLLRGASAASAHLAAELNAATVQLAEGQFLDIELQAGRVPVTAETYQTMIARKTGALFATACRLGAMAADASPAVRDAYGEYGRALGVAFQEQDDLLGVWGRASATGKPDAADIVERKRGLPAVLALSRPDAPDWLRQTYGESTPGEAAPELDTASVARVRAHFDALGLEAEINARVEQRYRAALTSLAQTGAREPARSYLSAISDALVARNA